MLLGLILDEEDDYTIMLLGQVFDCFGNVVFDIPKRIFLNSTSYLKSCIWKISKRIKPSFALKNRISLLFVCVWLHGS